MYKVYAVSSEMLSDETEFMNQYNCYSYYCTEDGGDWLIIFYHCSVRILKDGRGIECCYMQYMKTQSSLR